MKTYKKCGALSENFQPICVAKILNQAFLKLFYTSDMMYVYQGFHQVWYQGGVKPTVLGVVEDLKFKISEGLDQNW